MRGKADNFVYNCLVKDKEVYSYIDRANTLFGFTERSKANRTTFWDMKVSIDINVFKFDESVYLLNNFSFIIFYSGNGISDIRLNVLDTPVRHSLSPKRKINHQIVFLNSWLVYEILQIVLSPVCGSACSQIHETPGLFEVQFF